MLLSPPAVTRSYTLFPYTSLFRSLLRFAARRAVPLLCALDGRCTGRFDCAADKELWQTARMAAPSHTIVAHGTAEYAPRRRRWGGMGFAQARSCNIGPFRHALYRRHLLCGAAGGFLAAKAEDQFCTDSWARHYA